MSFALLFPGIYSLQDFFFNDMHIYISILDCLCLDYSYNRFFH